MSGQDDDFVTRWSRLKQDEQAEPAEPTPALETEAEEPVDEDLVASLPEIDSLDESSDFTAFLQAGVPEALRRRALRKLWRLNPVFANLDGLNDYDEDFTDAAMVIENLKTLYQVGKGMVVPEEEEVAADEADAPPEEEEQVASAPEEDPEAAALAAPAPPASEDETSLASLDEQAEPVAVEPGRAARRRWARFESGS